MIRIRNLISILSLFIALTCMALVAAAQEPRQGGQPRDPRIGQTPGEPRPNLMQELGLSREQIQAMRRLNQERKPVEQAARERFQEANRALNLAIYSDEVDEAGFKASLGEFQAAQAELATIKYSNELAVRRLLTPAQLTKFRELRRRFADTAEKFRNQRPNPNDQRNMRQMPPDGQRPPSM